MKTTLRTFCGGALLLILVACSENYTPKKYAGLNGKVVSLRDTVYLIRSSFHTLGTVDNISSILTMDFDERGNVIREDEYVVWDSLPFRIKEYSYSGDTLLRRSFRTRVSDSTYVALVYDFVSQDNGIIKTKVSNGVESWEGEVKNSGKYCCHFEKGEFGYSKDEIWADKNDNIIKWKLVNVSDEFKGVTKDSSNVFRLLQTYKYDSNGNKIGCVSVEDEDTIVFTYSYTRYDDHGNWIESKTNKNGSDVFLTKRTIKYAE